MKILILGHGRHGKDTAAAYFQQIFGLSFRSSSEAALSAIYPVLSHVLNEYDNNKLFELRHQYRELWRRLITLYNTPDKAALAKLILKDNDMYVGMRCKLEYAECMRQKLFDRIYWVDASGRKPLEPSMGIIYDSETMIRLDNNGGEEDLYSQIHSQILF